MKPLLPEVANKVYDILVEVCGANSDNRNTFVHNQTTEFQYEWRFMGNLGFGGKFKRGDHGSLSVDCYQEDSSPEKVAIMTKANDLLAPLWDTIC